MLTYCSLGPVAEEWAAVGRLLNPDNGKPVPLVPSREASACDLLLVDSERLTPRDLEAYRFTLLVEVDRHCPEVIALRSAPKGSQPLIGFYLGTPQAYRARVSPLFLASLRRCCHPLPEHLAADCDLPLHEAVVNAAIHGNLELNSSYSDLESMERFYRSLEQKLANPHFASRRVIITAFIDQGALQLSVSDQGAGHQAAPSGHLTDQPHGRGFQLMCRQAEAVRFDDGGRTHRMSFPLKGSL